MVHDGSTYDSTFDIPASLLKLEIDSLPLTSIAVTCTVGNCNLRALSTSYSDDLTSKNIKKEL